MSDIDVSYLEQGFLASGMEFHKVVDKVYTNKVLTECVIHVTEKDGSDIYTGKRWKELEEIALKSDCFILPIQHFTNTDSTLHFNRATFISRTHMTTILSRHQEYMKHLDNNYGICQGDKSAAWIYVRLIDWQEKYDYDYRRLNIISTCCKIWEWEGIHAIAQSLDRLESALNILDKQAVSCPYFSRNERPLRALYQM